MPFLTVDPASRRQRFLRGVAAHPRCMGTVAGALGLLPFWLKVRDHVQGLGSGVTAPALPALHGHGGRLTWRHTALLAQGA